MASDSIKSGVTSPPIVCSLPEKARRRLTSEDDNGDNAADAMPAFRYNLLRTMVASADVDDPPPTYRTAPGSEESHALPIMPTTVSRRNTDATNHASSKKRTPLFVYYLSAVQVIVFIASLIENARWTGSPIATKPKFNPMLGPSPPILISMGARFLPCMRPVQFFTRAGVPPQWPCPKGSSHQANVCTLAQLCGNDAKPSTVGPGGTVLRQWYRFITPMFLHSGFVHIGLVMLAQVLLGCCIERSIGTIRYAFIYILSGVIGALAGGSYGARLEDATGPSAAVCGLTSVFLLDVINQWGSRKYSWVDTVTYMAGLIATGGLALLPAENGYAHCFGALAGLLLGLSVMRSAIPLRRVQDVETPDLPLEDIDGGESKEVEDVAALHRPAWRQWLRNRKPLWWILLSVRLVAASFSLAMIILLTHRFYGRKVVYYMTSSRLLAP